MCYLTLDYIYIMHIDFEILYVDSKEISLVKSTKDDLGEIGCQQ